MRIAIARGPRCSLKLAFAPRGANVQYRLKVSLADAATQTDPKKAQELGKEQKQLNGVVDTLSKLTREEAKLRAVMGLPEGAIEDHLALFFQLREQPLPGIVRDLRSLAGSGNEQTLAEDLLQLGYGPFKFPVYHNVDAEPNDMFSVVTERLAQQVSSPVRCRSKKPADRCPTVLHPRISMSSPAVVRRLRYKSVMISAFVLLGS